ncbi:uncharacterized protein LOC106732148 isoform X2 [Pelodiscus sinensis]|uniref:uncharacterized protein LOC106732148 isoform X2 n=1 Tax=Pelodiscus sinensis TaxID=13735 RepID=UPI003F6C9502
MEKIRGNIGPDARSPARRPRCPLGLNCWCRSKVKCFAGALLSLARSLSGQTPQRWARQGPLTNPRTGGWGWGGCVWLAGTPSCLLQWLRFSSVAFFFFNKRSCPFKSTHFTCKPSWAALPTNPANKTAAGALCSGSWCVESPCPSTMMLRSGKITPREKPFSPAETSRAVEEPGPPARKAGTPHGGKRRWREEGAAELESPGARREKPGAQPPAGLVYFGDLPPEGPEQRGPWSLFLHQVLPCTSSQRPPRKETPIKTRSTPESTLVLELEGTLVCSSLMPSHDADCTFLTSFQGDVYREFLETLSKTYEIFVFTTAKQSYAEKMLDVLDPQKKLIRHCLYQQDCLCLQGYYVKDLAILERDLARTVALDDCPQGFPYQASNCVPIPSWAGDPRDEVLLQVLPLLGKLSHAGDVRTEIRRKYRRQLAVD